MRDVNHIMGIALLNHFQNITGDSDHWELIESLNVSGESFTTTKTRTSFGKTYISPASYSDSVSKYSEILFSYDCGFYIDKMEAKSDTYECGYAWGFGPYLNQDLSWAKTLGRGPILTGNSATGITLAEQGILQLYKIDGSWVVLRWLSHGYTFSNDKIIEIALYLRSGYAPATVSQARCNCKIYGKLSQLPI